MKQISKNCYQGELLTNPNDIMRLAIEKKALYSKHYGIKPAAIFLMMQFAHVIGLINNKELFFIINNKPKS